MKTKSFAVAVLVIAPEGIPLIRDPKKPAPVYWKLPGGRGESGETPEECAIREVYEETGIKLNQDDLAVITEEDRGSHTLTIFKSELAELPKLEPSGNEGEEVKSFPVEEILKMPDFFPNHRRAVEGILSG